MILSVVTQPHFWNQKLFDCNIQRKAIFREFQSKHRKVTLPDEEAAAVANYLVDGFDAFLGVSDAFCVTWRTGETFFPWVTTLTGSDMLLCGLFFIMMIIQEPWAYIEHKLVKPPAPIYITAQVVGGTIWWIQDLFGLEFFNVFLTIVRGNFNLI